jgi:hypothetical protein
MRRVRETKERLYSEQKRRRRASGNTRDDRKVEQLGETER